MVSVVQIHSPDAYPEGPSTARRGLSLVTKNIQIFSVTIAITMHYDPLRCYDETPRVLRMKTKQNKLPLYLDPQGMNSKSRILAIPSDSYSDSYNDS